MIRSLDLRGKALTKAGYQKAIPRAKLDIAAALVAIEPILQKVKTGTEADLLQLAEEFDRPDILAHCLNNLGMSYVWSDPDYGRRSAFCGAKDN